MGDAHGKAEGSAGALSGDTHVLLVVIVPSGTLFEAVVTGLLDIGLAGTVVDGKGLMAVIREEMPIFGGLASMLPSSAGTRVVLSAATHEQSREALRMFQTEFKPSERPIAMAIPMSGAVGLRH
jgi:hypothetical protein